MRVFSLNRIFFDNPKFPLSAGSSLHDPGVISDLYYADVYDENGNFSSWDADGDSIYGEWNGENSQDKKISLNIQQVVTPPAPKPKPVVTPRKPKPVSKPIVTPPIPKPIVEKKRVPKPKGQPIKKKLLDRLLNWQLNRVY